ncbi:MAG: VIT family protein [Deltaproteobacteria bacterium]|nr:MAG: VIT family protein [Deltaproteobacteria bacterium]
MSDPHSTEHHRSHRTGWLRAAVLGANDGLVSTASLVVGVAAASGGSREVLVAGVAGLVAGAMSMAAGEYVSVSSQSDTEQADLAMEREALATHPKDELEELAQIYVARGVEPATARQVAEQLTAHDALEAHAREELGITEMTAANPMQAAITSALTFAVGAALPLGVALASPDELRLVAVPGATILFLAILGALGAYAGGAPPLKPMTRVVVWGTLAMAITAGVGVLFGVAA